MTQTKDAITKRIEELKEDIFFYTGKKYKEIINWDLTEEGNLKGMLKTTYLDGILFAQEHSISKEKIKEIIKKLRYESNERDVISVYELKKELGIK